MKRLRAAPPASLVALGLAVLALAALGVSAGLLAHSQHNQRRDLRERYVERTAVASALVDALFRVAFSSTAANAAGRLSAPRVSSQALDRQVRNENLLYAFVLDSSGRLVGRSSSTPAPFARRVAGERGFIAGALRDGFALSNVRPGAPAVIESAVAFRTSHGTRLLVNGQRSSLYVSFLSGLLRPLPTLPGSMSFVLDGHNASIGSADALGRRPAPPRGLLQAAGGGPNGSYKSGDEKVFVATSRIPNTPFRIALSAPEQKLYGSVSGLDRWAPWIILMLGAAALVAVAVLIRRVAVANAALDVSRRRLEVRARELERSNADLEQFAYAASHDLSEPLRTVAGFSQLLRARYQGRLDADADDFIAHMTAGVERMQQLIDDLLLYSRVGRGPVREEDVDLEEVFEQVIGWLGPAIHERGAHITHDELPVVRGERGQVAQVLQNLVSNAIKFTDHQTPPEVHVSASREGRLWRISVRDNGIGVDGGSDVIFKMFGRLHPVDAYPGTGIGLALAKRIVEGHGGRIWVEPAEGGGSVFSFTLPAALGARRHAVEVSV